MRKIKGQEFHVEDALSPSESMKQSTVMRSTTVLCVRRDGRVVIAADGQVTFHETVMKATARKVRRLYNGNILAGFAGSTSDAMTLFERFESKLEEYRGQLSRAAVELGKAWRTDKYLRHLEALLLVADEKITLVLSGTGDVIEPDHPVMAIGSGGPFATAAARALFEHTTMPARQIAEEAMKITSQICVYTNNQFIFEEL
jgi:ATP-dependent HslUV protease, peptidase subunit HslV